MADTGFADYMYQDAPWWCIIFWVLCPVILIAVTANSILLARSHIERAKKVGFLGYPVSHGVRADFILFLLALPPIYAMTGVLQVFRPTAEPVTAFVRTCFFSLAAIKVVRLIYILAGGRQYIEDLLPTDPIKAFAAPPCCCFFMLPCCKCSVHKKIFGLQQTQIMVLGVRQFVVTAPAIGLVELMLKAKLGDGQPATTSIGVLLMLTTMWCMWSFNSLKGLVAAMVKLISPKYGLNQMIMYVQLHMLMCKIIDLVLLFAVKKEYKNKSWTMPPNTLSALIGAIVMSVCVLVVSLLGRKAFCVQDMYPEPMHAGAPLDLVPLIELHGIDIKDWPALSEYKKKALEQSPMTVGARTDPT